MPREKPYFREIIADLHERSGGRKVRREEIGSTIIKFVPHIM